MGLQQTILNGVAKAFAATDDIMMNYTFTSVQSDYDPSTSEITKIETDYPAKGFIDTDDTSYKADTVIPDFDLVLYLQPTPVPPAPNDKLLVSGVLYNIVHDLNIFVGDIIALHRVWLKK